VTAVDDNVAVGEARTMRLAGRSVSGQPVRAATIDRFGDGH